MTNAPKIDTQAPDALRDWPEWMDLGKQRCGWSNIAAEPGNMMRYIRADLADARAAAAYHQGLHDGIDKAANRYRVCASPDVWDYFYTAHNAMLDLKSFEVPAPEGQAALDRLIAERVREAVEAEREACAKLADENGKAGKFIGVTIRARGSEEEFNAKYASNSAV